MANGSSSDDVVPDEQITVCVGVGKVSLFRECEATLCSIKHVKVDLPSVCERERSLCSLLSCCPLCPLYALTVSPCLHTAGGSPRATAHSCHNAFGQMASWSPHRDWTLDTKRAWVCVLAALLPRLSVLSSGVWATCHWWFLHSDMKTDYPCAVRVHLSLLGNKYDNAHSSSVRAASPEGILTEAAGAFYCSVCVAFPSLTTGGAVDSCRR